MKRVLHVDFATGIIGSNVIFGINSVAILEESSVIRELRKKGTWVSHSFI
jgi:repressor of nif and glnA expression